MKVLFYLPVTCLPPSFKISVAFGRGVPSQQGTMYVISSPESTHIPVVLPPPYMDNTDLFARYTPPIPAPSNISSANRLQSSAEHKGGTLTKT